MTVKVRLRPCSTFSRLPFADREDHDRNAVVAHQADGRGVHDLQVLRQHVLIGQGVVAGRRLVLLGIGGIDAVHAGALQQGVAAHFGRAQGRAACRW